MKYVLPQMYFSKLMRAVTEFELINKNDKILIGVSGGKDSIFLSYCMAMLRERLKIPFEISALTLNPMFSRNYDLVRIRENMMSLDISFDVINVDIADTIKKQAGKDACYTCSFFRRGAINRYAKEHGFNKVAYAHHNDDAVETFLMGLLNSGQLHTFLPSTYLDKIGLTVIRPLVYFRESEVIEAERYHHLQAVKSPCPYDGNTNRQKIKNLVKMLSVNNPQLYPHLASAIRKTAIGDLWEAEKNRKEMQKKYRELMYSID